jgi:type II secretory pathway pseudopilin PulG
MAQQEQASQPQRKKPPPGWRYPDRAKHRSRLRGWLAAIWRGTKDNAALVGLVGVLLTLLVTTVLTQIEGVRQAQVAEQQAQQESLQTYLGDMGELILRDTSPLPEASPDDAVSELARAKTLTVLGGVDAQSMGIVLQFLAEARLIHSGEEKEPIITLSGADLSGAYLRDADLSGADLSNAQVVTQGQLKQQAVTLEGATMPDGSEHP